jgi:hypothetical protein
MFSSLRLTTQSRLPFGAGTFENGYDESSFDIKGQFRYLALKKKF